MLERLGGIAGLELEARHGTTATEAGIPSAHLLGGGQPLAVHVLIDTISGLHHKQIVTIAGMRGFNNLRPGSYLIVCNGGAGLVSLVVALLARVQGLKLVILGALLRREFHPGILEAHTVCHFCAKNANVVIQGLRVFHPGQGFASRLLVFSSRLGYPLGVGVQLLLGDGINFLAHGVNLVLNVITAKLRAVADHAAIGRG